MCLVGSFGNPFLSSCSGSGSLPDVSVGGRLSLVVARGLLPAALDPHKFSNPSRRKLLFPNRYSGSTGIGLHWLGLDHMLIPEPMTVTIKNVMP